jgi:uncharacterized protein YndB with AHSA1/START domain
MVPIGVKFTTQDTFLTKEDIMAQTEKLSLEIKRHIKAPRERVYAAWTDPVQLRQWFGPENVQTRNLIVDARVGGEFRWDLVNPEGENMTIRGEYRELQPSRKIVFTWQWQDDEDWENHISIVTVELSDWDGGTELRLTHEQLPNEESRDGHTQGWNSVLDKLEKFFSK